MEISKGYGKDGVQKRINSSRPETTVLRELPCKVGPWLASWELGFPPLPDKNGSLCLNCVYKECGFCPLPAFLLGVWSVGVSQAESLQGAPLIGNISQILGHLVTGGAEGEPWEACPWFPPGFSPCAFVPVLLCFVPVHWYPA